MEQPNARVVKIVLKDNVTMRGQALSISALRVFGINDGSVPLLRAIVQDPHIMAMKMHWLNRY